MSDAPKDLVFDFGINFKSAAERVKDEAPERVTRGNNELPYHHAFLDDILRGISQNDLIVLGAETGAGKTEFVRAVAAMNAKNQRRVYYFALEAEDREIERRTKYQILTGLLKKGGFDDWNRVNYADWYRGKLEDIFGNLNEQAERAFALEYRNLFTYYRGSKFDHEDIKRLFLAIQSDAELIILDHLHYVDIEDENENRGFKKTVKMIRDVALGIGRPVILVVHLRKRDMRSKSIVPDIEMVHGSSDIAKICTRAIMIAPARSMQHTDPGMSNTFFYVPKDRVGGATGLVALCTFDRNLRNYASEYALGRMSFDGSEFEPLEREQIPRWARRAHRPPSVQSHYRSFNG
jgi:energy-coupling factor transporter ATP-binding protein EcfA2